VPAPRSSDTPAKAKAERERGRPSKYNEARVKRIVDAISAGATRKAAAEYAGIDQTTLIRWEQVYSNFANAIKEAEGQAEIKFTTTLAKAAQNGDVRAAMFWLERRRPKDWGRKYEEYDMVALVRETCRQMGLTDFETDAAVAEAEREMAEARTRSR